MDYITVRFVFENRGMEDTGEKGGIFVLYQLHTVILSKSPTIWHGSQT